MAENALTNDTKAQKLQTKRKEEEKMIRSRKSDGERTKQQQSEQSFPQNFFLFPRLALSTLIRASCNLTTWQSTWYTRQDIEPLFKLKCIDVKYQNVLDKPPSLRKAHGRKFLRVPHSLLPALLFQIARFLSSRRLFRRLLQKPNFQKRSWSREAPFYDQRFLQSQSNSGSKEIFPSLVSTYKLDSTIRSKWSE